MTKTELDILKKVRRVLLAERASEQVQAVLQHPGVAFLYIQTWALGPIEDLIAYGEGELAIEDIKHWR